MGEGTIIETIVTYGPGGYDPSKPNDNIISVVEISNIVRVGPEE
jgi:hypothetical protein